MFEVIQTWLNANLLPIILTIAIAMVVARFGSMPITGFIRRTVTYRAHGDKTEQDVKKRQDTLIGICVAILKVLVWVTVSYDIIRRFGVDPAPLLAGAGVVGFAIAFGAQSLIKDFVSGMFIILENQYRVGDVVTLDHATGTVEKITIRTTVVRDEEGGVHYIPNGTIGHSVNKTMGYAKINLSLSVDSKTDVDKLAEVVNKVGEKMYHDEKWAKKLMEQPRFLNIGSFSNKAVEVKVTGKVSPISKWNVTNELKKRLLVSFERNAIAVVEKPATKEPKKKD